VRITTDEIAIMQNINTWSDDHLPCVSFEHNNTTFEVWWTEKSLAGRLEMVRDGDVTLEVALKKWPDFIAIVNDPFNVEETDTIEREEDDGQLSYNIEIGWVKVAPITS
jgi:hypothetical protein